MPIDDLTGHLIAGACLLLILIVTGFIILADEEDWL